MILSIPWFADLKNLLTKLTGQDDDVLSDTAVTVLTVMIDDYQRKGINHATRKIDNAVVKAIESSKTMQLLKPRVVKKEAEGRNIKPENFAEHLLACRKILKDMTGLSRDTRRITNHGFDGIDHILNNREQIIEHFSNRYGVIYAVATDLPIHTDHVPSDQPEEFYRTLERLIKSFFGAFYLAQEAGRLKTFCDKVSSGFCFEGKTRDPFIWASDLSEIKPFDELMQSYVNEYRAYEKVMHGKSEEEAEPLQAATDFICERHEGLFCKPHAPNRGSAWFWCRP